MPRLTRCLLALPLLLAACGEPRLDDPDAIAARIAEQAAQNFEGVRDFTIRGGGTVVYFRRAGADSLVAFEGRAFTDDSLREPVPIPYALPNGVQLAHGLEGNARLGGTTTLDDGTVYVLDAGDPRPLLGIPAAAPTAIDSVRVLVDTETFRVREVRMTTPPTALDPEADPSAPPLVQRQRYADFRTVSGLTLPFRMSTTISNVPVSDEDRAVRGGMLELQRRQAQQLPAAERARVLAEVERQMRFLSTGEMEETFTVEEARVNEGVPEGVFAAPASGG